MSIKVDLAFERISPKGVVERRVQPSRSFLIGLMQLLYCQFSLLPLSNQVKHIRFPATYASGENAPWGLDESMDNLRIASMGGMGTIYGSYEWATGDEVGIVIGTDTKAIDARDRGLGKRIAPFPGRQLYSLKHPGAGNNHGLAWDGTYFYVVDQVNPQSKIYRLNRYTGESDLNFNAPGDSQYSYNHGLCYDGTYLWCTGRVTTSPYYKVFKLDKATGAEISSWYTQFGNRMCYGLAWDGTYIWCADSGSPYQLHRCDPADGSIVSSITPPSRLYDLAWDGAYLWAVSSLGYSSYNGHVKIFKINPADGSLVQEIVNPVLGMNTGYVYPWGLEYTDGYLWLGDYAASHKLIGQMSCNRIRMDPSGCEVVDDESYVNPNGSFTVRRYFTNKSGGTITVNEVGIYALKKVLAIARDLVSPAVNVLNNETLKVEYTFQITV